MSSDKIVILEGESISPDLRAALDRAYPDGRVIVYNAEQQEERSMENRDKTSPLASAALLGLAAGGGLPIIGDPLGPVTYRQPKRDGAAAWQEGDEIKSEAQLCVAQAVLKRIKRRAERLKCAEMDTTKLEQRRSKVRQAIGAWEKINAG